MKPNTPDNVEGTIREVNGNFKEATGKLARNPRLENSGRREKTLGRGQRIHNSVERSIGEYQGYGLRKERNYVTNHLGKNC
jgi:uncharacterized protein YjbJ (UPF0337 family)